MTDNYEAVIAEAAEKLGMSVWQFKREIFYEIDREFDKEDVEAYLDANDYEYDDEDLEHITDIYCNSKEADYDLWSNIEWAVTRYFKKKQGEE